jgi:predicted dehydrogenase
VCDLSPAAREWFRRIPSVSLTTADYRELLASSQVDAVYVAVPHQLHEKIYLDVLEAGKDLLAEKPFGIDLPAARNIAARAGALGRFVRCSSEFPFLPGAQRVFRFAREGKLGRPLEVRSAFLHSSDLDPAKPVNWKRQNATCGEIGVMGDLGMHVMHLPLRLGWRPRRVYAQLQKVYTERPDGKGGTAMADTWDNAVLHAEAEVCGEEIPMRLEMKRLSPGDTNSWIFEVTGTDAGARFSTKDPKALWLFHRGKEQSWERIDLGFAMPFKTVTGGIFEPGFPDILQQMLAAFAAERAGLLGQRFGCVTPDEAVASHEVFAAALTSHQSRTSVEL